MSTKPAADPKPAGLSHAQKINTENAGVYVGRWLRDGFCAGGTDAEDATQVKLKLRRWIRCRPYKCWDLHEELWAAGVGIDYTKLGVNEDKDAPAGGMRRYRCRWKNKIELGDFPCYYIHMAEPPRQGYADISNANGTTQADVNSGIDPDDRRNPLAARFFSFRHEQNHRPFAIWLDGAGLGRKITRWGPVDGDPRYGGAWGDGTHMQVKACPTCSWNSVGP